MAYKNYNLILSSPPLLLSSSPPLLLSSSPPLLRRVEGWFRVETPSTNLGYQPPPDSSADADDARPGGVQQNSTYIFMTATLTPPYVRV